MTDVAMETGDADYRSAVRSLENNLIGRKYYVTGGVGSGETSEGFGKDYSLPNARAYCESCADCGELFFQERLNLTYQDARYADLGADMPATECLADVVKRFLPYWEESVVPDLRAGKVVLLAAHGNSLRALVKHLDSISDADIAGLNIPTGIPLRYELDDDLKPVKAGGEYLDPEAAAEAAAAVANQGR